MLQPIGSLFFGRVAIVATMAAGQAVAGVPPGGCEPHWDNTIGQPGISGEVDAVTVYNGNVIAGGWFATAGGQAMNKIARWDGSAWYPLTSGGQIGVGGSQYEEVAALTVYNGDLIAGGYFYTAGGQTVNNIARWDGTSWHPFTSGGQIGVDFWVRALTVYDGDLIAGGSFRTAGGQVVNLIARWDGSAWHALASGSQKGLTGPAGESGVYALTTNNGDLFAGGVFDTGGGQPMNRIARWDGSAWHPLTSGGQNGVGGQYPGVWALAVYKGDLIAGGTFFTAGGQTVNHIALWDGSTWHPIISGGQIGVSGYLRALTVYGGDLIAGGWFTSVGGQTVNGIARWDGTSWHPFTWGGQIGVGGGQYSPGVLALTVHNGELTAGGTFTTAGGQTVNNIAAWRGCPPCAPADINCDGIVNVNDLLIVINNWGPCPAPCPPTCAADVTNDCVVNVSDLLMVINNWG